jgi:hypothetical protein
MTLGDDDRRDTADPDGQLLDRAGFVMLDVLVTPNKGTRIAKMEAYGGVRFCESVARSSRPG